MQGTKAQDRATVKAEAGRSSDWVWLPGKTIALLVEIAVRSSFARNAGRRHSMMHELGLAKSTLLRRLDALDLR